MSHVCVFAPFVLCGHCIVTQDEGSLARLDFKSCPWTQASTIVTDFEAQ